MRNFERNQPVVLPSVSQAASQSEADEGKAPLRALPRTPSRFPILAFSFAAVLSAFWLGVWGAYLWGYLGTQGLARLELQQGAMFAAAMVLPPLLFIAIAAAFSRASQMGRTAEALQDAADYLFTADETASRSAVKLGRAVRRELDALNAGLDGAFARLRALETALENQVAALEEAGARAEVRGEAIAARLTQESRKLESLGDNLTDAASKAAEIVAGRAAQLRASIETAEGALKMATQALDVQAAGFRAAATAAADAPHQAAVELDNQAKKIEQVADASLARAEFVLARQEKHRSQMNELLNKLKEDSASFEGALAQQRTGMEQAIGTLGGEAKRFEMVTGDAERHLELIMANAASRANQLTAAFTREAERLKDVSETANTLLTTLAGALREAGVGAQTLIGESAAQARADAKSLVGEAMAECEKLLRAAGEMSAEAGNIRAALAKTVEEVERHLTRLPTLAQGEAQRVRQMVQSETDQLLDLSARTLSTIHARVARPSAPPPPPAEQEAEGLKGLARRLTQRPKRDLRESAGAAPTPGKSWEMKTLLAAAETASQAPLQPGSAAALGALELALSDMAVDLEAIVMDAGPNDEEWKRYLSGDRAVFARKLATAIDDNIINRITGLYREDARFHDAADAYISEFESLLSKAREGDGGGLLASTILSADTGKIYLAIAYALGRL
ncbi:MAG TPA: hypothetical protein VG501_05255 [Rhizomicrobium sp.]|nr:hypothetical protein [Rhizomicrobium sp.]